MTEHFNVIDDYKEMVKNQDLEISRQFEHSNMLFEKIDDIYGKFLELAKVTMNDNVMIQCHLEKEKELTEEIRVLKVINWEWLDRQYYTSGVNSFVGLFEGEDATGGSSLLGDWGGGTLSSIDGCVDDWLEGWLVGCWDEDLDVWDVGGVWLGDWDDGWWDKSDVKRREMKRVRAWMRSRTVVRWYGVLKFLTRFFRRQTTTKATR